MSIASSITEDLNELRADTGDDGTGMYDMTLTDSENPFTGTSTPTTTSTGSDSSGDPSITRRIDQSLGAIVDPFGVLGGDNTTASGDVDVVVDTAFENPGELPFVDSEDSVDLPLGAPRDPLNLDGGPPGPEGGAGSGNNTPANDFLAGIPWNRLAFLGALFVGFIVAVNAFAGGLAQGVTDG
jgi:hypothetical protein